MSHSKPEVPILDHEDSDHSQPINLAAPRPPAPPVTFTANQGLTNSVATQPVTLRTHTESQKPGLMLQALYIRGPPSSTRPPGPGHVMTQLMGNQVSSSQHFSTKPGPVFKGVKGVKVNYYSDKSGDKPGGSEFKNSGISGWTVIRMPPADNSQSQGSSTTQVGSGSLMSNILPNALAGNSPRHMVSASVHPVISGVGSNSGPMASIIKGTHQVSQVGHIIHPQYSSHVPRGPAAVASITSAPKSAVATPILRAPHSSSSMTLASSVISPHATSSLRTRSPTLVSGRTATPPVVSAIGHQQIVDLQKNSMSHSLQNQSQVGLSSRSIDITSSSIRSGISHSSAISLNKPISISQPIVQHLQQVTEKGYLKTVSGLASSNLSSSTQSNSTPAHQNSSHIPSTHSSNSEAHSGVPTIARTTLSNISGSSAYGTGIVQLSAGVPTLRPSLVQPHPLHTLTPSSNLGSSSHQTLTVISAKPLQSATPPVTPSTQLNRSTPSVGNSAVVAQSGSIVTTASGLQSTHSRLLSVPSSASQAATTIPIAKVYPQSLPATTKVESVNLDNSRTTAPGSISNSSVAMTSSISSIATTSSQAAVTERRDSNTPVRVTSLTKHPTATYTSVPSTTYLYDQFQGTALAVHPYSVPSSNQNFSTGHLPSTQMRPLALSQHGNTNIPSGSGLHPSVCISGSSTAPVQPLNSLMVAVDSRHITLHQPYNTMSSGKSNSELASHQTTTSISNATSGLVIMSQASSTHTTSAGQQQQQGATSNHLSPRPSILRKRTSEAMAVGITKRNLIPSLCATESLSPRPEFKPIVNNVSPSPKLLSNESLQENGLAAIATESESRRLLVASPIPVVKKELGVADKSLLNECPLETSPRKKPRKQLLSANELMETHSSDAEENFDNTANLNMKDLKIEESEDVRWVTFSKRPTMSLLENYRHSWKSRHNHFMKYTDVKPKEEKKPSAHELANQKGVMQEVNAWKIYHLTGQMEDLSNSEETSISRMSRWLDLEKKDSCLLNNASLNSEDYKILNKLTDIVKGNLQRSKIAQEQAMESHQQILKIVDHKPNIIEIVNKYISRRPLKKKDKT